MKKASRRSEPGRTPKRLRLLFVGEGPHDIGRDRNGQRGGALAGFLFAALSGPGEPCTETDWPFEPVLQLWSALTQLMDQRRPKRRSLDEIVRRTDDGRRVRAALVIARNSGLDGVVVLRDCEQRDRRDFGSELRGARADYEAAESEARPACVVATPSRSHETWLLADGDAVESILGPLGRFRFARDAEDRPNADALKRHIRTHAERVHREDHEIRAELAFRGRPDEIARVCPRQYPAFLRDVEEELKPRRGAADS